MTPENVKKLTFSPLQDLAIARGEEIEYLREIMYRYKYLLSVSNDIVSSTKADLFDATEQSAVWAELHDNLQEKYYGRTV